MKYPLCSLCVVQRVNDGLAVIEDEDIPSGRVGRRTIWVKRKARRSGECAATGISFPVGAEVFAPLTNGQNRAYRVLAAWVEKTCPSIKAVL